MNNARPIKKQKTDRDSLVELRREIDALDDEIISLVDRRLRLVRRIGQHKIREGTPVRDQSRENEIIARVNLRSRNIVFRNCISSIFKEIINQSRALQEIDTLKVQLSIADSLRHNR